MSDKITELLPRIRHATEADIIPLEKLAAYDKHAVIAPTHVVEKSQQIIGYLSVGVLPTVILWLDSHRAMVRDSMAVMNFFENTIADRGGRFALLPCNEDSPFRPLIEKVGYVPTKMQVFVKQL